MRLLKNGIRIMLVAGMLTTALPQAVSAQTVQSMDLQSVSRSGGTRVTYTQAASGFNNTRGCLARNSNVFFCFSDSNCRVHTGSAPGVQQNTNSDFNTGSTEESTGSSADSNTENTNALPEQGQSTSGESSYASEVIQLVNQQRQKNGLSTLSYDSELGELAQLKAEDMAENGYFSHQSPTYGSAFDMMKSAGVTYKTAGENIARGQKTPSAVMNSWMNSQSHRENILNTAYTSIGAGCATDSQGRICWVQMFKG